MLSVYQTGVLYHLVHALAVLGVGILADRNPSGALSFSGWAFVAGLLLFSGSLYALALSGVRVLGAVTPVGGVAFLAGWVALAWSTVR